MSINRTTIAALVSLVLTIAANGQVSVRLMYGTRSDALVVRIEKGNYTLAGDGTGNFNCPEGDILFISRRGDRVLVTSRHSAGFVASEVSLESAGEGSVFSLDRVPGNGKRVEYTGSLKCTSDLGTLVLINTLDIDSYISSVVQAEGGYKGNSEYFMTQAIIIRTYAYLHLDRHAEDGYNLCDDVHCQAYKGRCTTPAIEDAVKSTEGLVIADQDSMLILTPFHSNCGGETAPSEYVWLTSLKYLRSVTDPYCSFTSNATWKKELGLAEWLNYLTGKGYRGEATTAMLNFNQDTRKPDYIAGGFSYPLDDIRTDLGLRSTFFSVAVDGDRVVLSGRGYGHGVGLCQEGALVMATRGFNYSQIIGFYYTGVKIMSLDLVKLPEKEIKSF